MSLQQAHPRRVSRNHKQAAGRTNGHIVVEGRAKTVEPRAEVIDHRHVHQPQQIMDGRLGG
jgi:hypothetical protein